MGAVGLFYVGAVLFINGVALIGWMSAKDAAPMNLFVGGLQIVTPLYIIFVVSHGDPWTIFSAAGLFLFAFTYLYVGIGNLSGMEGTGVGWFSLFVAVAAVGWSLANFLHFNSPVFGVIWLMWSFLWSLFFILLALRRPIGVYTGWITIYEGWITGAIAGYLLLIGKFNDYDHMNTAVILAIASVIIAAGLFIVMRPPLFAKQMPAQPRVAGEGYGAGAPSP